MALSQSTRSSSQTTSFPSRQTPSPLTLQVATHVYRSMTRGWEGKNANINNHRHRRNEQIGGNQPNRPIWTRFLARIWNRGHGPFYNPWSLFGWLIRCLYDPPEHASSSHWSRRHFDCDDFKMVPRQRCLWIVERLTDIKSQVKRTMALGIARARLAPWNLCMNSDAQCPEPGTEAIASCHFG